MVGPSPCASGSTSTGLLVIHLKLPAASDPRSRWPALRHRIALLNPMLTFRNGNSTGRAGPAIKQFFAVRRGLIRDRSRETVRAMAPGDGRGGTARQGRPRRVRQFAENRLALRG
jgi:hypothetical protein